MYQSRSPQYIQHVIIFFNLKGDKPQASQSNTWVEFDKTTGVSIHDPHKIFGATSAKATYDTKFMHLNFNLKAQKSMDTTHIIIRALDKNNASTDVIVLNAISIVKFLGSYSVVS